ncbi:MFS transporter [Streptoverticillium reticulum]|uniref:MFS transporter n=1 Tax=Streptoverticillium reticulum TaxID=1433415 RepID=UPI0039BF604D
MEYVRLLRMRPVLVLWLARSLSVLGDHLYAVAVMWTVYASTGSASLMGLVATLESLPYVLLGTAGRRLVSRCASYRALSRVDAARAALVLALPFVWTPDGRGVSVLLVGVFALGILGALFDPNLEALLPGLAGPERVQPVTGLFDLTSRIARISGRAGAGVLLLMVSKLQLFAFDGAAFAVSAAALGWLGRRSAAVHRHRPLPGPDPSVRAWPLLRAHPRIGAAIAVHGLVPFCAAATSVAMPALLATRFGAGAGAYGLVTAALGVGALIGNPVAGSWRPGGWPVVCCCAWAVEGLATVGMGLVGRVSALEGLSLVMGLAAPLGTVTLRTRLARFPAAQRLRLMAVEHTAARSGAVASTLLVPMLADVSVRGAFGAAGSLVVLAAVGGLFSPAPPSSVTGAGAPPPAPERTAPGVTPPQLPGR